MTKITLKKPKRLGKNSRKSPVQKKPSPVTADSSADLVWARSGSAFSGPAAAFENWIRKHPDAQKKLWSEWKEAAIQHKTTQIVCVFLANCPELTEDIVVFEPLLQGKFLGIYLDRARLQGFKRYFSVFDQGKFELLGAWPPSFLIWFDGKPDGDCVFEESLPLPVSYLERWRSICY